jgi:hypothetical protein
MKTSKLLPNRFTSKAYKAIERDSKGWSQFLADITPFVLIVHPQASEERVKAIAALMFNRKLNGGFKSDVRHDFVGGFSIAYHRYIRGSTNTDRTVSEILCSEIKKVRESTILIWARTFQGVRVQNYE